MSKIKRLQARSGQALLSAVILVFVGSAIVAGTIMYVVHERRMSEVSSARVDAIHTAEAGVEDAINEYYKVVSGLTPWDGWSDASVTGNVKVLPYTNVESPLAASGTVRRYAVSVDLDRYLVTSTGVVEVSRFSNAVSRAIQVELEPDYTSPFEAAMLAKSYVKHGGNASVDSFDSSDPTKSTDGQYDPAKRQMNGDIVTICTDPDAAVFATGSGVLYGDLIAGIGGGVTISGSYTNLGAVGSGADTDISDVIVPMDTTLTHPAIKMNAPADSQSIVVAGNTDMSVSYIKANGGALTITGSGRLRLYVEGETSISGSATMNITPSPTNAELKVEIYANDDVLLNSCVNETGNAANLGIYGTDTCADVKYTGDSHFTGFMYTPHAAFDFSGQGDFLGAVVANTIDVTGTGDFHYDEALADMQLPFLLGYRIKSWHEVP